MLQLASVGFGYTGRGDEVCFVAFLSDGTEIRFVTKPQQLRSMASDMLQVADDAEERGRQCSSPDEK